MPAGQAGPAGARNRFLVLLLLLTAAPGPAPSKPVPSPSAPIASLPPATGPRIESLETALLHAQDADHADAISARLADARMAALSPTTRLMLRRAQRELTDHHGSDALSDAGEAIALEPDRAILWRERAVIQSALGNTDAAISDLGGALSRDPADVESWAGLSRMAEQSRRYAQSIQAWQRVLQLSPMTRDGAARLRALKHEMAGDPT